MTTPRRAIYDFTRPQMIALGSAIVAALAKEQRIARDVFPSDAARCEERICGARGQAMSTMDNLWYDTFSSLSRNRWENVANAGPAREAFYAACGWILMTDLNYSLAARDACPANQNAPQWRTAKDAEPVPSNLVQCPTCKGTGNSEHAGWCCGQCQGEGWKLRATLGPAVPAFQMGEPGLSANEHAATIDPPTFNAGYYGLKD